MGNLTKPPTKLTWRLVAERRSRTSLEAGSVGSPAYTTSVSVAPFEHSAACGTRQSRARGLYSHRARPWPITEQSRPVARYISRKWCGRKMAGDLLSVLWADNWIAGRGPEPMHS